MEEFLESEWARLETRISIRLVFDHKKAKTKKPNTMQFCFQLSWPHCCHVQPAVSTSLPRIWLLLPLKVCQLEWVSFFLVLPLCRVVVPTAAMFILHECTYKHIYTCVQLENSHTRLCVLSRFPPLNVVKMSKLQRCGMIPRWGLRSSVPSFQDLHVCHGFSLTHNWLLWKTEWLETHVYFPKVSDVFFYIVEKQNIMSRPRWLLSACFAADLVCSYCIEQNSQQSSFLFHVKPTPGSWCFIQPLLCLWHKVKQSSKTFVILSICFITWSQ